MAVTNRKSEGTNSGRHWPLPPVNRKLLLILGLALVAISLIPFWGSVTVAAVFAFGLYPFVKKIAQRFGHGRPRIIVGLCVAALALTMMMPVTFFSVRLYNLATTPKDGNASGIFSSQTLTKIASAKEKIEASLISYGVKGKVFRSETEGMEAIRGGSTKAMNFFLAFFSAVLTSLPDVFLELLVFCLFLYLFLSRGKQIRDSAVKFGIVPAGDVDRVSHVMQTSCYNSLISNLLIGLIQSSVVAAGARLGGYNEVVLIFSVVFLLSFIPFIGSSPLAFLLAGLSLLNQNNGSAVILLVTGMISGTIDNVIRPYLVANGENEVHPIVSFAVIIGAIGVLGIKGIFLGPVILTATVGLLNMPPRGEKAAGISNIRHVKTKQAS
ncbi:MAG: AI-2E family transporter [Bacteriovoracia bacterium]